MPTLALVSHNGAAFGPPVGVADAVEIVQAGGAVN